MPEDALHQRIKRVRGKASGYPCTDCGQPAAEWSYQHGEDPADMDSYVPRCVLCHHRYDFTPEREEQWQQSLADWHSSPEFPAHASRAGHKSVEVQRQSDQAHSTSSTGIKGVFNVGGYSKPWRAQVTIRGVKQVAHFSTIKEAEAQVAEWRNNAAS